MKVFLASRNRKKIEEMVAAQMHRIVELEEQVAREWLQSPGAPPAG